MHRCEAKNEPSFLLSGEVDISEVQWFPPYITTGVEFDCTDLDKGVGVSLWWAQRYLNFHSIVPGRFDVFPAAASQCWGLYARVRVTRKGSE